MSIFFVLERFGSLSIGPRSYARSLVAATILLAAAAPSFAGLVTFRINETKSPLETEEESPEKLEEALVNSQRRIRLRLGFGESLADFCHQAADVSRPSRSNHSRYVDGHRLPNGHLAPMTC